MMITEMEKNEKLKLKIQTDNLTETDIYNLNHTATECCYYVVVSHLAHVLELLRCS